MVGKSSDKTKKAAVNQLLFLERVVGIEPTFPAWKAGVLPIYDTRILWWKQQGSNL